MASVTDAFLKIDNDSYPISDLTEFGFTTDLDYPTNELFSGFLELGDSSMPVQFKIRRRQAGNSLCTFSDFSIAQSEQLKKYLKTQTQGSLDEGSLEHRSYDELADGLTTSTPAAAAATESIDSTQQTAQEQPVDGRERMKMLATMILLFTMIGLAVIALVFVKSRSSLSVNSSALVGNYLPINSRVEGEITDVVVSEGDHVKKGDVLVRLDNPEIKMLNVQLGAQLRTALSKTEALTEQLKAFETKLEIAKRKLSLDLEVAKSEYDAAKQARDSARSSLNRLVPYVESGSITQLEFAEAELRLRSEESNCIARKNQLQQVKFSQEAAQSDLIVLGDRLDDEKSRIQTELSIAKAEYDEIKQNYEVANQRFSELVIKAPRDGQVYVNYRQVGEFVKMADEIVALSYPGKTWAAGQVISSQASRILPGQPVAINIPSMDMQLDGTVLAVGHRAMYSNGHYTAEFRGSTATDVPVKVYIADLPNDIPSGLRLDMSINTGFGIGWLDNMLGYELRPIGNPRPLTSNEAVVSNQVDSNIVVTDVADSIEIKTKPVVHVTDLNN